MPLGPRHRTTAIRGARPCDSGCRCRYSIPAYCIEQIARHQERLGIQQMGFRLHWPGMPHQRVLQAIELLGEHVLPHFA
jgi:hypothetical protein